jgi:lipopolysaccharide transport system ATP-binding protein
MGDVAEKEGRTVLFVSHNMTTVNQLCSQAVLIKEGIIQYNGITSDIISKYLETNSNNSGEIIWDNPQVAPGNERIRLKSIRLLSEGKISSEVAIDKELKIEVQFWNLLPGLENLYVDAYLLDNIGNVVLSTPSTPKGNLLPEDWYSKPHPEGLFRAVCTIPADLLNNTLYYLSIYVVTLRPIQIEAQAEQILAFNVFDTGQMLEIGGGT